MPFSWNLLMFSVMVNSRFSECQLSEVFLFFLWVACSLLTFYWLPVNWKFPRQPCSPSSALRNLQYLNNANKQTRVHPGFHCTMYMYMFVQYCTLYSMCIRVDRFQFFSRTVCSCRPSAVPLSVQMGHYTKFILIQKPGWETLQSP